MQIAEILLTFNKKQGVILSLPKKAVVFCAMGTEEMNTTLSGEKQLLCSSWNLKKPIKVESCRFHT